MVGLLCRGGPPSLNPPHREHYTAIHPLLRPTISKGRRMMCLATVPMRLPACPGPGEPFPL